MAVWSVMDFTIDDINSLGDKLAAMDLTSGEREALRTMTAIAVEAGDDDEVAGFGGYQAGAGIMSDGFGSLGLKLGPPKRSTFVPGGPIKADRKIILAEEMETI